MHRISLGVYPDVGLKRARDKREQMRKLVADGVDPSAARKQEKLATLECYRASNVTRYALQLAPLVFVRPGELRKAEWNEMYPAGAHR